MRPMNDIEEKLELFNQPKKTLTGNFKRALAGMFLRSTSSSCLAGNRFTMKSDLDVTDFHGKLRT